MSSQFQLMRERRFRPLFLTQFLGAFNDNVFKTALITLVTFRAGQLTSLDGKMLATLLPGLFILPFFLFSATSGQIADKFEKSSIARMVKVFEIAVMLLAAWGFIANLLWPLVIALFLMGVHSTLFGPVKYAYLPQHLKQEELVGGNGMIEMGTFVAILLGEVLGAWLVISSHGNVLTAAMVVVIAMLGYWVSRDIPHTPAADPYLKINWNPLTETYRSIVFAQGNRVVWLAMLGISWFWFFGATLLAQFPTYAQEILGGDERIFIVLLTVFSLGIGIGSLLCEKLSSNRVELGLVPFGAIGLSLFGLDLYFASTAISLKPALTPIDFPTFFASLAYWRVLADIMLIGLYGGFYIVPLYALLQTRSEQSHQSRIIAANNILNALFMVASALVSMGFFALGLSIPQLFLATALFNALVAAYIYFLVPESLIRFIKSMLPCSLDSAAERAKILPPSKR
ncbi:MAG: MFS transporter [Pseudomonadota bacterium]